jgi:1,4-alpha-glucan branching enzyme
MAVQQNGNAASAPPAPDYRTATDGTGVIALDPWLEPFAPALRSRYASYNKWLSTIDSAEGGLDKFSQGYKRFGFHVDPSSQAVTYREWAPGAQQASLIGDFNGWDTNRNRMKRDQFGVWECTVQPTQNGKCPIEHNSKLKISMVTQSGERIDRLPAWIK